jgi:hypothetical protein
MRARGSFAALLLLAMFPGLATRAGEPRAALKGPGTAPAGAALLLDFAGTQGDHGPYVKVKGPEAATPEITLLYNREGKPVSALVTPTGPGAYVFTLVAVANVEGKAGELAVDVANLTIQITGQTPSPGPGPQPAPAPTPIPSTVALYAIAVYSVNAGNADELAFSTVRDDRKLQETLRGLNVHWRAWDTRNAQIDKLSLRPYVEAFRKTPMILIYDDAGRIYDETGATTQAPVAAPLTVEGTVALFKRLRGAT